MIRLSFRACLLLLSGLVFGLASSPAHAVVGETVVTDGGKPIPGAKVSLNIPGGTTTTGMTDPSGKTSIPIPENPQPQTGKLIVEREGLPPKEETFVVPPGEKTVRLCADTAGGLAVLGKEAMARTAEAATPLKVGTNSEVGSGARTTPKASDIVSSALGGVMGGMGGGGGMFGRGGGSMMGAPQPGHSSADQPATATDPISASDRYIFTDPATGVQIGVAGKMTPQGMLISSTILNSPDDGTFQDVHLQDPDGRNAGPTEYYIYDLYRDWSLRVWWTRDTYVNGQHVSHEQGGWSTSGRDFMGSFKVPAEGDGIWKRLGFSSAAKGVRSLGTLFPLSAGSTQTTPYNLVIHVTRPGQDMVTTVPFVLAMPPGNWADGGGLKVPLLKCD
ncbi:MAG: hypothetical protein EPN26_05415 [Rhodospirillales bacterium]|nr:MAG: hypothetical protein EPN26_05415 [Rhodospirillales bacterium]